VNHNHPFQKRFLWFGVFPALIIPCFGALLYFVWFAESNWVQPVYGSIKVFTLVWPLIATYFILKEGVGQLKALFKFQWGYVLEGAGWGLLMSLSILIVLFSPVGNAVNEQAGMVREKAEQMGVVSHFVLFGLFLSLLHSLLEEYYWRWFVFGNLHRFWKSKRLAYGVGALAFASHHIVVTTQFFAGPIGWIFGFAVGIGGAIWSWLMTRHRSIIGAWVSHIIVDITLMSVGYWLIFHASTK
jgi:membrane protease YdiL (CAAX protease family)